jgi:predicted dehydrogenase
LTAGAEDIDAVIIASPNSKHLDTLQELGGSGLPVFLEKPLETSWESICDVARWAESYRAPVMVGHCMRYAPILQKARELIESGAIGKVCSATFVQNCHYGNGMFHGWRRTRAGSGTQLIEKATHDLDVMQWLLNAKPVSVFASQKLQAFGGDRKPDLRCRDCDERLSCPESTVNICHRWMPKASFFEISAMDDLCVYSSEVDCPDDDICLIQFDSGVHATYTQHFYTPRSFHHRDYQIIGDGGAMDIDLGDETGGKILVCKRFGTSRDVETYSFDYLERNHYNGDGAMIRHFYDVIAEGIAPFTTVDQAFVAEALGYSAVKSAQEGRVVSLEEIVPSDLAGILSTSEPQAAGGARQ